MQTSLRGTLLTPIIGLAILAGCGYEEPVKTDAGITATTVKRSSMLSGPRPQYAPQNPYLADSVLPIGHINSAQTTGVDLYPSRTGSLRCCHFTALPQRQAGDLEQWRGAYFQA